MNRWEKFNIVQGFLNTLNEEYRMNWHITIDNTYDNMLAGKYGRVIHDKNQYCILINSELSSENAYFFTVSPSF